MLQFGGLELVHPQTMVTGHVEKSICFLCLCCSVLLSDSL